MGNDQPTTGHDHQPCQDPRAQARARLAERLLAIRQSVTASGLDRSVVDEAIAAARARD